MASIKEDKRLHLRRDLRIPLVFQRDKRFLWSITEDIGRGGLFLKSLSPPDLGEELEIHLRDPWAGEAVSLQGTVVHRREQNKATLPGDEPPRPAGAGVAFRELSPLLEERLRALLSSPSVEPPSESHQRDAVRDKDPVIGDNGEGFQVLEDQEEIRQIFECLCKKIHPVRVKRLGGQIFYAAYIREVLSAHPPISVQVEAVELKDFDSAFSEIIPFVFQFDLEDRSYVFSVIERPKTMARNWSFPLPTRLYYRLDRRTPRYSDEIKHPLTVEFPDPLDPNLHRVKNLLDIGFGGVAFKSYPGEEIYSPGQFLSDVTICDADHVCRKTDAVVRHATLVCLPEGEVFQKVGIEFANEGSSVLEGVPRVKEGELEQIAMPAAILQHLRKVAQSKVKILTGLDHSILFSDGLLRAEKQNGGVELTVSSTLLSESPESDFLEGRMSYHYLFRGTYHFFSTRTRKQNGFLRLEIPTVINRARRRKVLRVRPKGMMKSRFRCLHPVLGRKISFSVRDLSIRGLSFEADYVRDLFWKGFRLRSCEILLEDQYYPLGGVEVRSLVHRVTTGGESDKHCGVEFLDLPAETERYISAYIFQKSNPQIRAPTAERVENLWQLFERSGFLYPSKMAYIRKIQPEINETWKRLLSAEMPFYKNIVFREGEEELGTASAVQAYENTWLLQHLAASSHPVKLVPKDVMLGLAQFLMENREIKYLITYFRKENSFPRKMYSGFLERYPLEEQLRFMKYSFLSLDLEEQERVERVRASAEGFSHKTVIEHAMETDKEIIESYFQRHLHPLLIRSRSLSRDVLHLPETSALFRSKGLKRERTCLVARKAGQLLAFSLLENASPGINLSGLLNTFSLHTIHPDHQSARESRRRLLEASIECYLSWRVRVAICLTAEEDLEDYLDAGFKKEKEYICLSWSRRTIKSYYDYVQEKFSRFEERKTLTSQELPFP